jgi:hypothetical protein
LFAFIAFAAVAHGRGGRGAYALRLTVACASAAILRIVGYGAQGLAARQPLFVILLYLIPLLGVAAGAADVMGFSLSDLFDRRRKKLEEAPA